MTKCPSCFVTLIDKLYRFACVDNCAPEVDPEASKFYGAEFRSRPFVEYARPDGDRRWQPPVASCPKCNGPTTEVCPLCHYVWPTNWRAGQATCVALSGARYTGKSVFLAVVVQQLEFIVRPLRTTITPHTELASNIYSTHYVNPLYEQRRMMAPTATGTTGGAYQRDPLIFSLGNIGGTTRYLVIRDVAGEDLEEVSNHNQQRLAFFKHADTVLFMFDPLRVKSIRDILQDAVPNVNALGGEPVPILHSLIQLLRPEQRIGVVLSKFDTVQLLKTVDSAQWQPVMANTGAAFRRDPSLTSPAYDDNDGQLLHEELRSLLLKMQADNLINVMENPSTGRKMNWRLFAVSALGAPSHGDLQNEIGISPFRCTDPLKWALAGTGVIASN